MEPNRPRVYGCTCNCLTVLMVLLAIGVGLLVGFQFGWQLATTDTDHVIPRVIAVLLIVVGAAGLLRQLRRRQP